MLLRTKCYNIVTAKQCFPQRHAGLAAGRCGAGEARGAIVLGRGVRRTSGPAGGLQAPPTMTPRGHPFVSRPQTTVLWLEVTPQAAKGGLGLAAPFRGLFLVFPGNQVHPERSPVWNLLLRAPAPPPRPGPASSADAGHVSPSAPSAAPGAAEARRRPSSRVSRGAHSTP